MKTSNWLVLGVALGMMALTGGYLERTHQHWRLGAPGVRVGPAPLYDEQGHCVAQASVLLPDKVFGATGTNLPITRAELDLLPKDTTFGRKLYRGKDNFKVQVSVVLMGSDRTSIHEPQYCLVAQDWTIDKTERVLLPIDRPHPYEVPALKLTTSGRFLNASKQPVTMGGIYVYWFVSGDKITSNQGTRLWSIARTMVEKGELERWAYISYFASCLPGREEATFQELEKFIRASVPDFQTVTGQPSGGRMPVAAR